MLRATPGLISTYSIVRLILIRQVVAGKGVRTTPNHVRPSDGVTRIGGGRQVGRLEASATMKEASPTESEQLLRGLAAGDETSLGSVLSVPRAATWGAEGRPPGVLSPVTSALVHLAGLLAAGGSTTSLRWAVEFALRAGARDEEIVEVLSTVAAVVGSARVVTAAPRLALAIGYDVEVEGWDGY